MDQQVGNEQSSFANKQVWVRGELTIRIKGKHITKGQYGGADIKMNKTTNQPISIADDLKAAASDSLKKCASMLGIADDVYWKDLDDWNQTSDEKYGVPAAYSHRVIP